MADNTEKRDTKYTGPVKPAKSKKPLGERISKWFREIKAEIKKITWPSGKEVFRNTMVTLVLVLFMGAIIWLVDFGLNFLRDYLLQRVDISSVSSSDKDVVIDDFLDYVSNYDASPSDFDIPVSGGDSDIAVE